jgi:hypothetical protein
MFKVLHFVKFELRPFFLLFSVVIYLEKQSIIKGTNLDWKKGIISGESPIK